MSEKLRVAPQKAARLLTEQIKRGYKIVKTLEKAPPVLLEPELRLFRGEYDVWHESNGNLLRRIFDSAEVLESYDLAFTHVPIKEEHGEEVYGFYELQYMKWHLQGLLYSKIRKLESIKAEIRSAELERPPWHYKVLPWVLGFVRAAWVSAWEAIAKGLKS